MNTNNWWISKQESVRLFHAEEHKCTKPKIAIPLFLLENVFFWGENKICTLGKFSDCGKAFFNVLEIQKYSVIIWLSPHSPGLLVAGTGSNPQRHPYYLFRYFWSVSILINKKFVFFRAFTQKWEKCIKLLSGIFKLNLIANLTINFVPTFHLKRTNCRSEK